MARPQSGSMAQVQKAVTRKTWPLSVQEACKKFDVKENSAYKSAWYKAWRDAQKEQQNA